MGLLAINFVMPEGRHPGQPETFLKGLRGVFGIIPPPGTHTSSDKYKVCYIPFMNLHHDCYVE